MNFLLGHADGHAIKIDLDAMLRTRLLVQGNSGAGKSWLLRRLAEQLFGKVPVLILDPEGEFATLREKYGYVLVGKGGETPADIRSAALVAHKLLELRASAVCDLYEVKSAERHRWVKLFLEALVDAPKKLWHPTVVIVDEAHLFCPEKGTGDSEALEAMIDLATRGRKRGLCAVFATQRLGKLRKDAAAELLNVLIGSTFIDVDRERAADALGIARADKGHFFEEIRLLAPGQFWGLGRAVALERVLIKVGPVATSHPESGSAKHAAEPPPPPEKVRALLPKLADLPQQAEAKAKTEAELRTEVRTLKADLATALRNAQQDVASPAVKAASKRVEVPVLKDAQVKRLEDLFTRITAEADRHGKAMALFWANQNEVAQALLGAVRQVADGQRAEVRPPAPVSSLTERIRQQQRAGTGKVTAVMVSRSPLPHEAAPIKGGPQEKILGALSWWQGAGIDRPTRHQVAFVAGYTVNGHFNNVLGNMRTEGLIDYPGGSLVALTPAGTVQAGPSPDRASRADLVERVRVVLRDEPRRRIFNVLAKFGGAISREDLAHEAGYTVNGHFNNILGSLSSLGVAVYPQRGHVALSPLFDALD